MIGSRKQINQKATVKEWATRIRGNTRIIELLTVSKAAAAERAIRIILTQAVAKGRKKEKKAPVQFESQKEGRENGVFDPEETSKAKARAKDVRAWLTESGYIGFRPPAAFTAR